MRVPSAFRPFHSCSKTTNLARALEPTVFSFALIVIGSIIYIRPCSVATEVTPGPYLEQREVGEWLWRRMMGEAHAL